MDYIQKDSFAIINEQTLPEFDCLMNNCLDSDNNKRNLAEKFLRYLISLSIKNYFVCLISKFFLYMIFIFKIQN